MASFGDGDERWKGDSNGKSVGDQCGRDTPWLPAALQGLGAVPRGDGADIYLFWAVVSLSPLLSVFPFQEWEG